MEAQVRVCKKVKNHCTSLMWYLLVVSILPAIFWWQQIGWSYCAGSWRFGLVAWCNTKEKVTLSRKCCPARCVMARCYGCNANGLRFDSCLADFLFFLCFFPGSTWCYL